MESGDKQEISGDIDDAGNRYCDQRHFGIPDPTENTAEYIVGDDEERSGRADPDVGGRLGECLLRCLHKGRERGCTACHKDREDDRDHGEHGDPAPDDHSCFMRMFFPDLLTDEDGDPHRDPGDHGRDALQDLTFSLNDP